MSQNLPWKYGNCTRMSSNYIQFALANSSSAGCVSSGRSVSLFQLQAATWCNHVQSFFKGSRLKNEKRASIQHQSKTESVISQAVKNASESEFAMESPQRQNQESSNMFQPSLQQEPCLWHAGLRPLMPRVAVGFPVSHCKYVQIDQQNHAKATYLLGFDVCYHFQGKANVLWRSPDHVRCSCSFLAWQSEVCCSSISGFAVFAFNKVCWQSEASELKPPVMNHFMSPNIGLSMQRKLLRPFINNWR